MMKYMVKSVAETVAKKAETDLKRSRNMQLKTP
jgi:hypothetical protein